MKALKQYRFWVMWAAALGVISWYYLTDPDGGAETIVRLQWMAWLLVAAGPAYLLRKAMMPGDSRNLLKEAMEGSLPAAVVWFGMAILTGILFLAFAGQARAEEWPPRAATYLPTLQKEIEKQWPDIPKRSTLAGQVEQETCPSLKSKQCWSPTAELKTSREYGFGLGQLTRTAKFDNFSEARKLSPDLRDWQWKDRFDASRQLRTMILMDRGNFNRLSFVSTPKERLAMALAAYNGGLGGMLSDRRVCASVSGCDPGRWFGHVELHSLKAKKAASGYGKSFFEINREYPRNILGFRGKRYAAWFGEV